MRFAQCRLVIYLPLLLLPPLLSFPLLHLHTGIGLHDRPTQARLFSLRLSPLWIDLFFVCVLVVGCGAHSFFFRFLLPLSLGSPWRSICFSFSHTHTPAHARTPTEVGMQAFKRFHSPLCCTPF